MCLIKQFLRTGFYGTGVFCDEKKKLLDYFRSRKAWGIKQNTVLTPLTEEWHGVCTVYFVFSLLSESPTLIPSLDIH